MFRQGQLAVHGLVILLGRNEAGISNMGKFFLHHAVYPYVQGRQNGKVETCTFSANKETTKKRTNI